MRCIRSASGAVFQTTDAVAEALVDYAWALGDYGRRDVVRIPVRDERGDAVEVVLLLGPLSQLSAEAVPGVDDDLDPVLAVELRHRTTRLRAVGVADFAFDAGELLPPR